MSQPSIVILGHACIDHNTSEHATYTSWGSSVLYMAQYYQKHHAIRPTVITSHGPDMLAYLPGTITLMPSSPNQPDTLVYENDSSTSRRTQHCHNQASAIPPAITPDIITTVGQADIIIVATLLPNYPAEYLQNVLSYARSDSLKVLCPQGYFRHIAANGRVHPREFVEASDILPLFDLVMYSEEDHPKAMVIAKQWKQSLGTKIIVTQNASGATIVEADENMHIPTHAIPQKDIVDSVGCGDTFAATVALNYYDTKTLPTAILAGHEAAGQKLLSAPQAVQ